MKKLSYFIVLLASIFSLNMLVSAETCKYNVGMVPPSSTLDYYSFLTAFANDSNNYSFMRTYAANKYSGMTNEEFSKELKTLDEHMMIIGTPKHVQYYFDGDMDHLANDMTLTYSENSANLYYSFYDWGDNWWFGSYDNASKSIRTVSYDLFENVSKLTRGTCPDAISFSVVVDEECTDSQFNSYVQCIRFGKELYLSDYNYDYISLIGDANLTPGAKGANMILFKEGNVNVNSQGTSQQDNSQLLNAISCTLDTVSSGFSTDEAYRIKNIIDGATRNPDYNIRNIYEDVVTLSVKDAEDTIRDVKDGNDISTYKGKMIYNYILTLPYFEKSTASEAYQMMQDDIKTLENYKNEYSEFENCLSDAYGFKEKTPKEAIKMYMEYDKTYQGLYTDAMIQLLSVFTEESIKNWYDASKETKYVDDLANKCQSIQSEEGRKLCEKNNIKNDIEKIQCTDLLGKDNLTPSEKVLKSSLDELCKKSSDYNCYLTKCDEAKKNSKVDEEIENLIEGNTDAQNSARNDVNTFYEHLIEHTGVKLESDLCIFFSQGVISEYIDIGLNIVKIGGPILVILLSALDAMKALASQKDDENKKFYSHLKIRLICLALLFFIPAIVQFILDIIEIKSCGR